MARFDVYATAEGYLLDVQTNLITGLRTRLMIPLLPPAQFPAPVRRLHPIVQVNGRSLLMATHLMAAVPERHLGRPVGNLMAQYDEIVAAIDMIFNGF